MIIFIFKGSFGGSQYTKLRPFFLHSPCAFGLHAWPLLSHKGRASEHRAHSCKGNGVINVFDARKACRSFLREQTRVRVGPAQWLHNTSFIGRIEQHQSSETKRYSNMPDQEDFCTARLRFSLVIHISGNSTTASYRASFRRRSGIWIYTKRMPHWKWIF